MFGRSHKHSSSTLGEAIERIRALQNAYDQLYREYDQLRSNYARALAQSQKNRLDFVEAVQRADRLERKLLEVQAKAQLGRSTDPIDRSPGARGQHWSYASVSDQGSLSDSGSFDPASYEAEEGETAVDTRPWDVRRGQ